MWVSIKAYGGVSEPGHASDGFWRIALGDSPETCFLMTAKFTEFIDFRVLHHTSALRQP